MKLEAALSPGWGVLDYMERYVNDGSPSGFTLDGKLSPETSPFGTQPSFHPYQLSDLPGHQCTVRESGRFPCPEGYSSLFVHPDALSRIEEEGFTCVRNPDHSFVPTSSGRTCRVLGEERGYYIKMSYPGTLGRVDRSLPAFKAIAGIEVTDEIATAFDQGAMSKATTILPEVAAVIARAPANPAITVCHVIRAYTAYPEAPAPAARVPLFSFWSGDRRAPDDRSLLTQVEAGDPDRAARLVHDIASTLIGFFFGLWRSRGLLYEVNAQNVLVELDSAGNFLRVVLRDFNSTEKDAFRRRHLGLPMTFEAGDYKIIAEDNANYRQVRHSFAFDFKLCQYAIAPLLDTLDKSECSRGADLLDSLRQKVEHEMRDLPADFFPSDRIWWAHPRVDLTRERPYVQLTNPMLR